MSTRWCRLLKYARWRDARLPLHLLPEDVLYLISTYLHPMDTMNLIEAVYDAEAFDLHQALKIPTELRASWMMHNAIAHVEQFVSRVRDACMFYATCHYSVVITMDWSPFCERGPSPIAEYYWTPTHPYANVVVFQQQIYEGLLRASRARRLVAAMAAYTWYMHDGKRVLHPRPVLTGDVLLFTHRAYNSSPLWDNELKQRPGAAHGGSLDDSTRVMTHWAEITA